MAQIRNPSLSKEGTESVTHDVKRMRHVIRFGPEWADIVVIENHKSTQEPDEYPPVKEDHGPASSDAFAAWAIPDHMREN